MIPEEIIKLGFLGVGTAIGYFLKNHLDQRKEAEIRRIQDRRDHYRNLILCLKSIAEGKRVNNDLLRFEYFFLWLYAPDAVIYSFNHLLGHLKKKRGQVYS